MGYGGNLIWTTIFKVLNERSGRKLAPVHTPSLSDILSGRAYDASKSLADDAIFRGNPRLEFPALYRKPTPAKIVDRIFERLVSVLGLRRRYELWVLEFARRTDNPGGPLLVHIDMRVHSYAAHQNRRRTTWKSAVRAADAMLEYLGGGSAGYDCEIYFDPEETQRVDAMVREHGLQSGFIAIEPDTNAEYFGTLRAWPRQNWIDAVGRLRREFPDLPILQLGIRSGEPLEGVIDFRGKTSFREASLLVGRAVLFIGTEGGLMHAANAVRARALIIWGGITLPEFIGYPDRQTTLCKHVPCAPCGQHGWCGNKQLCMVSITVDEVVMSARKLVQARP